MDVKYCSTIGAAQLVNVPTIKEPEEMSPDMIAADAIAKHRYPILADSRSIVFQIIRDAVAKERSRAANLAWEMQMENGGGTSIGNAIQEGRLPEERKW
jgi:hypothetical protein